MSVGHALTLILAQQSPAVLLGLGFLGGSAVTLSGVLLAQARAMRGIA